jgi:hypothetical protein
MGWNRRFCLGALAILFSAEALAESPPTNNTLPSVYTVKSGDTLWGISSHFLKQPWLWPSLWQANPEIQNPHLIYPGDELYLVWVDGQPQLRLKGRKTVSPKIKVQRAPITTLQASILLPYLSEFVLKDQNKVQSAPKVLGSTLARGQMSVGDRIWVDRVLSAETEWWIYRPSETYQRALNENRDISVTTLQEVAQVAVLRVEANRTEVRLTGVRKEIRQNDVLFPAPKLPTVANMHFLPKLPQEGANPTVLGHVQGRNYIATSEVIVMDRGQEDTLQIGQVFSLLQSGAEVGNKKGQYFYSDKGDTQQILGRTQLGEAMIIRAFEHFSLAVVLKAKMPFKAGVIGVSPENNDG